MQPTTYPKSSKRQLILDRAMAIAKKEGLREVTAVRVAKELRMVPSGVYYYFSSNKQLRKKASQAAIGQAILQHQGYLAESPIAEHIGLEQLYIYIDSTLKWAHDHPHQVGFVLEEFIKCSNESIGDQLASSTIDIGLDRVKGFIDEAIAAEQIRIDPLDCLQAANFIHLGLIGLCVRVGLEKYDGNILKQKQSDFLKQVNNLLQAH